jgi:hypothetical protein
MNGQITPPQQRVSPRNDLDFNLMITETLWGSGLVSPELQGHLTKHYQQYDEEGEPLMDDKGKPVVSEEALWGMMSYYTRDLRLSNLSYKSNEIQYCMHYLDLAGDFLKERMLKPFLICLSRVATVTELAQSKGGFLRRQMNTLRTENVDEVLEPPKKSMWGGKK